MKSSRKKTSKKVPTPPKTLPKIKKLELKLAAKEHDLQARNEELAAFNEEIQTTNEELRVTNEELRTTNEELIYTGDELKAANNHLNTALEELESVSDIPALFLDDTLRIANFTPAINRLVKLAKSDINRQVDQFSDVCLGKDLVSDAKKVLATSTLLSNEVQCRGAWYLRHMFPRRSQGAKISGVTVSFTDITERKNSETQLRDQEVKFRSIFENNNDAIVLLDVASGRYVDCNQVTQTMSGYSREEIFAMSTGGFLSPPHKNETVSNLETIKSGGVLRGETEMIHKNGTLIPVEFNASMITIGKQQFVMSVIRDITERKRMEAEIGMLAKFPSENPNPILRVSKDGAVLYANNASGPLMKMWGCAVGSEIRQPLRQEIVDAFATETQGTIQIECEKRFYSFVVVPVAEAGYVNLYGRDITIQMMAEEAVRESELRYRQLVQHAPAGIYEVDFATGRFTEVNDMMCRLLGYTREELLNITAFDILDEEGKARFASRIRQAQSGNQPDEAAEYRVLTKDGRVIWGFLNTKFHWNKGRIVGATVVAHDVTERKLAEMALRESEERFKAVAEATPVGIGVVSIPDATFLYVNQAYVNSFGYAESELLGRGTPQIYWSTEERDRTLRILKEKGNKAEYEVKLKRKDGSPFSALSSVRPITYDGKPALLGAFIDITDRKDAEQKILQASEELLRKNDELTQFNNAMVDREMRMIELKEEINELCARLGQPPAYEVDFDDGRDNQDSPKEHDGRKDKNER